MIDWKKQLNVKPEFYFNSKLRWTALMEACNFGHKSIVEVLLSAPNIDLDSVNLRGQRADDVAVSRGHEHIAQIIKYVSYVTLLVHYANSYNSN